MSKPIPQETIEAFRTFCVEREADEDLCGHFGVSCLADEVGLELEDDEGESLWEFSPEDEEVHDFYELFENAPDGYEIEEHGHDDFYVVKSG